MPDHPEFPARDEEQERVPNPERIIERIINGRLTDAPLSVLDDSLAG